MELKNPKTPKPLDNTALENIWARQTQTNHRPPHPKLSTKQLNINTKTVRQYVPADYHHRTMTDTEVDRAIEDAESADQEFLSESKTESTY